MDLHGQGQQAGPAQPGMPLRDLGSFVYQSSVSDAEIKDHRSQDTVYVGLHMPRPHRHRRARHRHGHGHRRPSQPVDNITDGHAPPPSQHIQYLLGEEEDDEEHKSHDLFCEMGELFNQNGEMEWKETARWIKFEEDVEEGGERWSKPHVATLSLHSLFELRSCIHNGTVILDMDAQYLDQVIDITLDNMVASNQLENMLQEQVRDILLMRHRHLNEKHEKKHEKHHGLPLIRSLADIGKKYSLPRDLGHHSNGTKVDDLKQNKPTLKGVKTMPNFQNIHSAEPPKFHQSATQATSLRRNESSGTDLGMHKDSSSMKLNLHFMKKIPPGAEAANILVGEVDILNHQIVAFVRLSKALLMGDLTEVPVPTKFLFILLGPVGHSSKYHEIGRSIATLMSDEIFHDVAYHAHNREDLLAGIDEFLDQVTVLPPGEWDPSIRIEPPKSIPSQESRKTKGTTSTPMPNGKAICEEEEKEESHGDDPTLQRTGRLFGGLIADIKRKLPHYKTDITDALCVQSLASFMFLYFACLTPIITFGGLLSDATGKDLAALESLLAGCIVGVVYALFSGQPLTILGSTGPILVFETIMYNFCSDQGLHYLSFRFWVGLWTGLILIVMVAFDLSALVRYITRFTEESFAALISLIFIKEAFAKLIDITQKYPVNLDPHLSPFHDCICLSPDDPRVSTTTSASTTSNVTNTTSLNVTTTPLLANVTVPTTVLSTLNFTTEFSNMTNMTTSSPLEPEWHKIPRADCEAHGGVLAGEGCKHIADIFFFSVLLFLGTFAIAYFLKSMKTKRFFPAKVRSIISDFAVMIAIVSMVVFDIGVGLQTPKLEVPEKFEPTNKDKRGWVISPFVDQNPWWICLAAIIPALLGTILIFMDQQITAVIVNRKENKLKKGCGYHLDLFVVAILIVLNSLLGLPWFVAATVLSINHVMSLKKESECTAPGERPKFLGVREQRVTGVAIFLVIGLSVFLTRVLRLIPMPVLYGVFLYMGVSSLKGMQLVSRVLIILMPIKYQPDYIFLRHVRTRRVHFFTIIQVVCLVLLWAIKTVKAISIAFPIMVLAMCFIRKALDWVFTQTELKWLDDIMPELHKREKEDKTKEIELQHKQEEEDIMLDPKNYHDNQNNFQPKASIINLAINASQADSLDSAVNISEEISKTANWKTLQSNDTSHSHDSERTSSGKRLLLDCSGTDRRRKHKKHSSKHKKDDDKLPTIPSSPVRKGKKGVGFYIDEAEELLEKPTIIVDPPSDSSSLMQNYDDEDSSIKF